MSCHSVAGLFHSKLIVNSAVVASPGIPQGNFLILKITIFIRSLLEFHKWQILLANKCFSFSVTRVHTPMIAVGSDDGNQSAGGKVQLFEFNEASR